MKKHISLRNCHKIAVDLILAGVLSVIVSLLSESVVGTLVSNIIFGFGVVLVVASVIVNMIFWKCPHCKMPLPSYWIIHRLPEYTCDRCKQKVDIDE
jgi:hypothetical protein